MPAPTVVTEVGAAAARTRKDSPSWGALMPQPPCCSSVSSRVVASLLSSAVPNMSSGTAVARCSTIDYASPAVFWGGGGSAWVALRSGRVPMAGAGRGACDPSDLVQHGVADLDDVDQSLLRVLLQVLQEFAHLLHLPLELLDPLVRTLQLGLQPCGLAAIIVTALLRPPLPLL